ncbi:MAG: lipopolysaccharide biosynthesis protein [Verrucomicrobiales bacterium]
MTSAWPPGLRLGGAFVQLLTTVLIARSLGAEAAGIYFFWAAAMMEAGQTATFGLDRLALRQVPRLQDVSASVGEFLASVRTAALLLSLVLAGGLCAYSFWVQTDVPRPAWWYLLPPVAVLGVAFTMINGEAMAGMGRPVLAIVYRHTIAVVALLLMIALLAGRLTADLALVAYTIAFALSGLGALAGPGLRDLRPKVNVPELAELKQLLGQGFPIFLSGLFAGLAMLIPLALLERTHPGDEVSYLTTALRIFVLFDVLAKAVHSLAMPQLSRAAVVWDLPRLRSIYGSVAMKGLGILGLPALLVLVLSTSVMEVFGADFSGGSQALRILMVFGLLSLLLGPAHQVLLMVGRTRRMAFFSLIHFVITTVLAFLVVPRFGAAGLAAVLGFGIILEKVLYLGFALRVAKHGRGSIAAGKEGEHD